MSRDELSHGVGRMNGEDVIDYRASLDTLPDPLPIRPLTGPIDLTISPPGSKSITNRAYALAAIAEGESRIVRPLRADDTDLLLEALCTLGARARWDGDDVIVTGVAGAFPVGGRVNLGDGGTPVRFMLALACLCREPVTVDGSPRMRERPVAEGIEFLGRLGADIEYLEADGRLPVLVSPAHLRGRTLAIPTTMSSQFISALMLIAPALPGALDLGYSGSVTSVSYVEMTCGMLRDWGVHVERLTDAGDTLAGHHLRPSPLKARTYVVEPDASSAVYWWAAALMNAGSAVRVPGIGPGSLQPDMRFLELVEEAGAEVEREDDAITVRGGPERPAFESADASLCPDAALMLAACAAAATAQRRSRITGLRTLRYKETDRIAALDTELLRVGCDVQSTDDTLAIGAAPGDTTPANIETYDDHRIAMAFAVLGLARPGLAIIDPACVAKSYPSFWQDLARVYESCDADS